MRGCSELGEGGRCRRADGRDGDARSQRVDERLARARRLRHLEKVPGLHLRCQQHGGNLARHDAAHEAAKGGHVFGERPRVGLNLHDARATTREGIGDSADTAAVVDEDHVAALHVDAFQRRQELPRRVGGRGAHVRGEPGTLEDGDGLRATADDRRPRERLAEVVAAAG